MAVLFHLLVGAEADEPLARRRDGGEAISA
jgi:hypothetical protein